MTHRDERLAQALVETNASIEECCSNVSCDQQQKGWVALEIDTQADGKPEESEELKVSADGRTLTIVRRPANSSAVFTMVWDKQ